MATVPTPPQITVRPAATTGALEFFWTAPTSDGGSAITGYTLSCTGLTPQSLGASTYKYTYTGLTNGTSYTFSITAENTNGSSPAATFRTVQPGNKPGPVQNLAATRTGATTITLDWDPPASDGGAALTGYFVRAKRQNHEEAAITRSVPAGETSILLKSLAADSVYEYTVQAVNDPGYSQTVTTGPYSLTATWNIVPTYTPPDGNNWSGLACDISGTKLIAVPGFTFMPMYRSADSGTTWTDLASRFPTGSGVWTWRKTACSDDGRVIYATTTGGHVFISVNFGESWTQSLLVSGSSFNTIACSSDGSIAITAISGSSIYITTNTGSSWVAQVGPGARAWSSVCCSKNGQFMAACGNAINVFVSSNAGSSWTQYTITNPLTWNALACSSTGSTVYITNGSGGIFKSIDSGATWTQMLSISIRNRTGFSFGNISCSADGTRVYSCTTNGIWRSVNSGTNWSLVFTTWTRNTGSGFISNNCNISCTPNGMRIYAGRSTGNIWTSGDGGNTWSELTTSPRIASFAAYVSSSDGTKLIGAEFGGNNPQICYLWRSTDSGTTWTRNLDNTTYKVWRGLCSTPDGSFVAATDSTNNSGWVWSSSDSGATWTQQTGAGQRNWRMICCDISGIKLYTCDTAVGGNIWASTDSGATWTALTTAGGRTWRGIACSEDGTKVVAAVQTSGYIYTSTDSGATWTERTSAGLRNWTNVASSADGTILLGCVNGGVLYKSSDSGATWTALNVPSAFYLSVAMSPNGTKMMANAAYAGTFVSTDGGANWIQQQKVNEQNNVALAMNPDQSLMLSGGQYNQGPFVYKLWG